MNVDKLLFEVAGGNHYTVCSPYNNELMADKVMPKINKYTKIAAE